MIGIVGTYSFTKGQVESPVEYVIYFTSTERRKRIHAPHGRDILKLPLYGEHTYILRGIGNFFLKRDKHNNHSAHELRKIRIPSTF